MLEEQQSRRSTPYYGMNGPNKVSEGHVIEAFHVLARESLAEARQDGLIDNAFLQEATQEELQILGPARKQSCQYPFSGQRAAEHR